MNDLPCDLFGRFADAFVRNAVVGGINDVDRMSERGRQGLLDQTDLHGKFFEPSQ